MASVATHLALTIDDAPMLLPAYSQIREAVVARDVMDEARTILKRLRVPHCVAFVIGAVGERNPAPLARWLEAGYELGNHTYDHVPARQTGQRQFLDSVDRCHAFLEKLGAFAPGRPKWFRFPLLCYGADPAARRELHIALAHRGYNIAHASTDLYDHSYEGPLGLATRIGDAALQARIVRRFHRNALFSIWQSRRLVSRCFDAATPLVVYTHFGRVSLLGLAPLLEHLSRHGAKWCSLEEAHTYHFYERLSHPTNLSTGLATADLPRRIAWRCARKALSCVRPIMRGRLRRLGPEIPALEGG